MKTDTYTKVVLTVIAVCLVWMSLGGASLITPVEAQNVTPVRIVGWIDSANGSHQLPLPVVETPATKR